MKKAKIMLVTDVFGWGGHERALKIKEHLSDEFDFDIVDAAGLHEFEQGSNKMFIPWKQLENMRARYFKRWTKKYINIGELLHWMEQPRPIKRDYDLYYLMFHTMLCWQEIKRIQYAGGKILSVVTGMPVVKETFLNDKEFHGDGAKAITTLCNRSVAIAANNKISLKDLKTYYDGPTYYIPRGVDTDVFVNKGYEVIIIPAKKDNRLFNHHPGGTIWPDMPEEYKEAYRRQQKQNNFACVFVGKAHSGKGLKRFIEPACKQLGIPLHVNEKNYTNALSKPQMCNMYNMGHVYVVASVTDGTPNPALEAAACGRPIISNPIGNMPEFIKNGKNGFLIGRDVGQIKDALIKLKENPGLAKEMSEAARQTVLDGWTWKHAMVRERKMLREILS